MLCFSRTCSYPSAAADSAPSPLPLCHPHEGCGPAPQGGTVLLPCRIGRKEGWAGMSISAQPLWEGHGLGTGRGVGGRQPLLPSPGRCPGFGGGLGNLASEVASLIGNALRAEAFCCCCFVSYRAAWDQRDCFVGKGLESGWLCGHVISLFPHHTVSRMPVL